MHVIGGWWRCLLLVGLLAAVRAAAEPFAGLSVEQRREIADSLDQGSRQAVQSGDYTSALHLIDAALAADPTHYRSWMNRWNLLLRQGLGSGATEQEIADLIQADMAIVEAAQAHEDQAYVLSFADGRLFQLTGDSTHLERRTERLVMYLAEHPDTPRAFDFHLSVAKWVEKDDESRVHFLAAQQTATTPDRRRAWSQAAIERGISRPGFLSEDGLRAALTQWHSTLEQFPEEERRWREEANIVLWHGQWAAAHGDTVVIAHLVNAYAGLRQKLRPHEQEILDDGWQAPVGPFDIMDCRADAMHGDLAILRGDREAATAHYRRAWKRLSPLLGQWDRSRAIMAGEHLRSLRQRLLPYAAQ